MFAKPAATQGAPMAFGGQKKDEDDDDDNMYKDSEEDDGPTVVLADQKVDANNPFSKMCEKDVEKFKTITPVPKGAPADTKQEKRNCGNGRVSIQRGELGPEGAKILQIKLIFRNNIGKMLFEGTIVKNSKMKRVIEKVHKN